MLSPLTIILPEAIMSLTSNLAVAIVPAVILSAFKSFIFALVIAKSAILTHVTPSPVPVESGSLSVTTAPS